MGVIFDKLPVSATQIRNFLIDKHPDIVSLFNISVFVSNCDLSGQENTTIMALPICKHQISTELINRNFLVQLETRNMVDMKCLIDGCSQTFDVSSLSYCLDDCSFSKLCELLVHQYLEESNDTFLCSDCNIYSVYESGLNCGRCSSCEKEICVICCDEIHPQLSHELRECQQCKENRRVKTYDCGFQICYDCNKSMMLQNLNPDTGLYTCDMCEYEHDVFISGVPMLKQQCFKMFLNNIIEKYGKCVSKLFIVCPECKSINQKFGNVDVYCECGCIICVCGKKQHIGETCHALLCEICETYSTLRTDICPFHYFCTDCITQWIDSNIQTYCFDVRCMGRTCNELYSYNVLINYCSHKDIIIEQTLNKYLKLSLPGFQWCPKHCGYGGTIDSNQLTASCSKCNHLWCSLCTLSVHQGWTCAEYIDLVQIGDEDKMAEMWKRKFSKKCPKCLVDIEKEGGCSHIVCRACSYEFCWIW
eukprot:TRINITY_DN7780_c0_g1_i1.p1 TRINITY_DN7780_c0_g1~~TRINITY_DN7780_c0_g1_i1.p1  ORF type:complete len:476 (-),score=43.64 TRINITY_DN7780_c0_g1_i1:150-1577(-)